MASKFLLQEWMSKRFFEFRIGNKMYIGFSIALINFILIVQRFFIDTTEAVHEILSNIAIFAILFLIIYLPLATLIGKWHYAHQYKIDNSMSFFQATGDLRIFKLLFDLKTHTANPEEVESFKKLLYDLEKKSITSDLK